MHILSNCLSNYHSIKGVSVMKRKFILYNGMSKIHRQYFNQISCNILYDQIVTPGYCKFTKSGFDRYFP